MASGRADYWYGMLPGISAMGVNQSEWFKYGNEQAYAGATVTVIEYTVPADYELNITGGLITCNYPGINNITIYKNAVLMWQLYFDQTQLLPFNVGSTHVLSAGDVIKINAASSDSVSITFIATLFGFLEYKVV